MLNRKKRRKNIPTKNEGLHTQLFFLRASFYWTEKPGIKKESHSHSTELSLWYYFCRGFRWSSQLQRSVVHVKTWKCGVACKIKASELFMHLLKYEYPVVNRTVQSWSQDTVATKDRDWGGVVGWVVGALTGECRHDGSTDVIVSGAGLHCVGATAASWIWNTAVALQSHCCKTKYT